MDTTKKLPNSSAIFLLAACLAFLPGQGSAKDGELIALKKKAAATRAPTKQIYELSQREETSDCLKASGVSAYVVSAAGSNRGLLLRSVQSGFASSVGMQSGDVLLSLNNRVIQSGREADRILQSSPSGPARIIFVHPSANGLQLYNTQVNLPTFSASTTPHIASGQPLNLSAQKSASSESMPALEKYMIELINHDRGLNGSPPIQANAALTEMARTYARDMAARGFFGHSDPDGNDLHARTKKSGIGVSVFENLAYQNGFDSGYQQVQMMEANMMDEPRNQQNHRSNILDKQHATVGVGVVRATNGKLISVQEFSHESP